MESVAIFEYIIIYILHNELLHVKLTICFFTLTYSFFNLDKLLIFSFVSTLLSNAITFMFSHYQQILYPNRVKTRRHVWTFRFCFLYYNIKNLIYSTRYKYNIDNNTTITSIITEQYHTINLSITSIILEAMVNRWVTSKYHHRIKDFVM